MSLREAIADLTKTFGDRYPGGEGFLKRLDALGPQPAPGLSGQHPGDCQSTRQRVYNAGFRVAVELPAAAAK